MMMPHVLAAALVSDCKTLAHPASVDSIPTSANQEDHTSMCMNAALHARKIVENIESVVAIELLCGFLGLSWRLALAPLLVAYVLLVDVFGFSLELRPIAQPPAQPAPPPPTLPQQPKRT